MIRFNCDKCGRAVELGDQFAGQLVSCPSCSNGMVAPKGDATAMSPATISPLPRTDKNYSGQARAAIILVSVGIMLPVLGWVALILAIVFGFQAINRNTKRWVLPVTVLALGFVAVIVQVGWWGLIAGSGGVPRNLRQRMTCGTYLTAIAKAIGTYASDNSGCYPLIRNDAGIQADAAMDAGGSDDVWKLGSAKGLNANENLNLLIPEGYIQYKTFICPASRNTEMERTPGTGPNHTYGFKDRDGKIHLDYAYQVCYTNCRIGDGKPAKNAAPLVEKPNSELVILADKPDPSSLGNLTRGMSHKTEGINYLRGDGSVVWSESATCGWGKNNIYLRDIDGASTPPNQIITPGTLDVPNSMYDSVLLVPK